MLPFRTMVMVVAAVGLLSFFATAPLSAAPRVALVIGNASYEHAPALANPLNDAADMGAALERLGFAVTRLENGSDAEMRRGLNEFRRAASASEVAVVFYAGHGIEVDGRNFLVPVDARLATDQDVEYQAIPLELAQRAVERASGLRLVILDACRENPFAVSMQRAGATRSIGRGLARVEPSGETLVAYAAKEGTVASDGDGRNSPYSEALLRFLEEPNLEVMFMLRKVRDAVLASTGGSQEPFWYGSLSSKGVYLAAGPEPEPAPSQRPSTADGSGSPRVVAEHELLFWESVKDSEHPVDIRLYLDRYPGGIYEGLARNRLERLEATTEQAATPVAKEDVAVSALDEVSTSARLEAERLAVEREFWASIKDSRNPNELQAYLDRYPEGAYAILAGGRLKRLAGSTDTGEAAPQVTTEEIELVEPTAEGEAEPQVAAVSAEPVQKPSSTAVSVPTALAPEKVEASLGLERAERRRVQLGLTVLGFDPGSADGLFGRRTRKALRDWQSSQTEDQTGYLDADSARILITVSEKSPVATASQEGLVSTPAAADKVVTSQPQSFRDAALSTLFRAIPIVDTIPDRSQRVSALVEISEAQVEVGNAQDAKRTLSRAFPIAREISDPATRSKALVEIALGQAVLPGNFDAKETFSRALSAAESVDDGPSRGVAILYVAEMQASTEDIFLLRDASDTAAKALPLVERRDEGILRANSLSVVAAIMSKSSNYRQARNALSKARLEAQNIGEGQLGIVLRASAFALLALSQSWAGETQVASEFVSTAMRLSEDFGNDGGINGVLRESNVYVTIVRALLNMDELSDALAIAEKIEQLTLWRVWCIRRIAEASKENGDDGRAIKLLSQALAAFGCPCDSRENRTTNFVASLVHSKNCRSIQGKW